MTKKIAILGSTGSIGQQALEVIGANPEKFQAQFISAAQSSKILIKQALEFKPRGVAIADKDSEKEVRSALSGTGIRVYSGKQEACEAIEALSVDMVLNAIVGYAGFEPTLCALKAGKQVALANKESLVVGGELVTKTAKSSGTSIIPVDSEHSAIFQCLQGEKHEDIRKVIITASGGPFLNHPLSSLKSVKPEDALNHPTWNMGDKISIDSATMMNKGLEVIEARWLFNLQPRQLEVLIHPQSIIHSMVEFIDGSIKAQLSTPDMRFPIIYALSYPGRINTDFGSLDLAKFGSLTFQPPEREKFRNLALAFEALDLGGNVPCVLNASNEIAVDAYLKGRINFLAIPEVIEHCLKKISYIKEPVFEDYVKTNEESRIMALEIINNRINKPS